MGRASKNSWAKMKGVLVGSILVSRVLLENARRLALPFGTNLISSHHVIGTPAYLLQLRKPVSISFMGALPQRSCFCFSLRVGLASTK